MLGCLGKVPPNRSLFNVSDYIIQQLDRADHILRGTELSEGMNESGNGIRNRLRDGMRER